MHQRGPSRDQPKERGLEVGLAGAVPELVRCQFGDDPALAHQDQVVAAVGLVHHVTRHQQGRTGVGECMKTVPQVCPQDRIEADGGLVEDEQCRRTDQRAGDRHPTDADRRTGRRVLRVRSSVRPDRVERAAHAGPVVVEVGEVRNVLLDGQVGVHRRGLRDVADQMSQRRGPGRPVEDRHRAGFDLLGPDDGAHQGGLAAARRTEEPGDGPRGYREVQVMQDRVAASLDRKRLHDDRCGRGHRSVLPRAHRAAGEA